METLFLSLYIKNNKLYWGPWYVSQESWSCYCLVTDELIPETSLRLQLQGLLRGFWQCFVFWLWWQTLCVAIWLLLSHFCAALSRHRWSQPNNTVQPSDFFFELPLFNYHFLCCANDTVFLLFAQSNSIVVIFNYCIDLEICIRCILRNECRVYFNCMLCYIRSVATTEKQSGDFIIWKSESITITLTF